MRKNVTAVAVYLALCVTAHAGFAAGTPSLPEQKTPAQGKVESVPTTTGKSGETAEKPRIDAAVLKKLRAAADKGDAKAQVQLGYLYYAGKDVAQDYAEAVKWFKRAAAKGEAHALSNLGKMYSTGTGVQPSDAEAVGYFRQAAGKGLPDAMLSMGLVYSLGKGVQQDYVEAYKWFSLAEAKGVKAAGGLKKQIGSEMGKDKIAKAEELAKAWKAAP